ncbi:uncharacterized protein EV420DRAFT_1634225 [Desarmillaria tabescens]|uniref:Uncharacterized protein n=1 Tax=Armillaria tabescens TaxID=1929756 RepID=A0AA39NQ54_ARMTA|nr:uncharacterized protein EV420DRAFT_1634225 [Desarmillaria tabescens]KAK0469807.1 hypothetical protein EV420DRAFT_1634225 [Desarmillaria tabescens]
MAQLKNKAGDDKVLEHVYVALAVDPCLTLTCRVTPRDLTLIDDSSVKSGTRISVDIIGANKSRPVNALPTLGLADYGIFSGPFFNAVVPQIMHENPLAPRDNLFTGKRQGCTSQMYINGKGKVVPWPDSLTIQRMPPKRAFIYSTHAIITFNVIYSIQRIVTEE